MNRSVPRMVAILAAIGLLAARTAVSPPGRTPELNGTAWVLSSLPGGAPVTGSTPTLRIGGGQAQGTDGCNRYSPPYSATGSTLQVGVRAVSMLMACAPEGMARAEASWGALTGARSYRVEIGQLATFARQSESLAGTSWRVTGYDNGKQAVVSVRADTIITMAFSADGKVSGSAGCNRYTAEYTSEGQRLTFSPAAATRMMCAAPGVMEQERQFLKALESVATALFEGDRVELRTATGALVLTLMKEGNR